MSRPLALIFCDSCGTTERLVGHHDDYADMLAVRPLCGACHDRWHRENTAKNRHLRNKGRRHTAVSPDAVTEKLRVNFTPAERRLIEAEAKREERSVANVIRLATLAQLRLREKGEQ